jgi:XTP/dITP diphosphohydrolase
MTPLSLKRGDRLVIATHNAGKLAEFADLLAPFGIDAVSAGALGLPEPDETGLTFEDNAAIKAGAAARASGLPALADDSGICVAVLGGAPGIYSARWAGPSKDFAQAMRNVEEAMAQSGSPDRHGWFVAVLCLAWPDGRTAHFRGEIHGDMVWPPRGTQGFGYDPMFRPEGHERTFGEMPAHEKHGWTQGGAAPLSHRARAFALFAERVLAG